MAGTADKKKTVFYVSAENGRTRGRSGRSYAYVCGSVTEAPDGELDHVGGTTKFTDAGVAGQAAEALRPPKKSQRPART
jgi:hypothetical protein